MTYSKMAEGCGNAICEATDYDGFTITCLKQSIHALCKKGEDQDTNEDDITRWISMKIRYFRSAANKGVHKHGILHVWRRNAFPWRPPWCRWHCSLQKPGEFSTKIRF